MHSYASGSHSVLIRQGVNQVSSSIIIIYPVKKCDVLCHKTLVVMTFITLFYCVDVL